MLHTILFVLKILGIILLVLLCVLLLLLLTILFLPISYRLEASYDKKLYYNSDIRWLFSIIHFRSYFDEKQTAWLKIFGIKIYDKNKKSNKDEPKKRKKKNTHKVNKKEKQVSTILSETPSANIPSNEAVKKEKETNKQNINEEKPKICKRQKWFQKLFQKLCLFFSKCKKLIINIKYTFCRLYDNMINVCNIIHYYYEVFQDDKTKAAYQKCKKQIYSLWKNIKPRYFQAFLHIGNENPEITGEIMALNGLLYPFITNHVQILPEYDQNVMEGKLYIKGHITVFVALKVLASIYFDKNVKAFFSMIKREDKNGR